MKKRERLALIVAKLALGGRVGSEELAEMLDIPDTTVYSDIRTLRRSGIPIHGEPGPGGGFTLKPDFTKADLKLAPRDAALLVIAAGVLLSRPPAPAGAAQVRSALQNALAALPKSLSELCAAIWNLRYAPPDMPDVTLYSDLQELLTHAILGKLPLKLDVKDADGRIEKVILKPEAVQWSARGWRLIGKTIDADKQIEIELESVQKAQLDGE
ncbi:MAG: HTH domain-containing protein [Armatimonadota bacterium]|nr:HTH domain-containing protein [Armatimonadota bacterium]